MISKTVSLILPVALIFLCQEVSTIDDVLSKHLESRFIYIPIPGITVPTTTTTTQAPVNPPTADSTNFMNVYEQGQNYYRSLHGCPALTRSNALAAQARVCAQQYATQNPVPPAALNSCTSTTTGEIGDYTDLLAGQTASNWAQTVLNAWYTTESQGVTLPATGPLPNSIHFTQLIWKSSTQYGCAIENNGIAAGGAGALYFISCVYSPAGNNNDNGGYSQNVPSRV